MLFKERQCDIGTLFGPDPETLFLENLAEKFEDERVIFDDKNKSRLCCCVSHRWWTHDDDTP